MGQQLPASINLIYEEPSSSSKEFGDNDGFYSINADKSIDKTNGMNILADYVSFSIKPFHSRHLSHESVAVRAFWNCHAHRSQ